MYKICSLFSGIGGFELGLAKAGHEIEEFCESNPAARTVLAHRFPDIFVRPDVRSLRTLPSCDVLTAGWPCQDISQAGSTVGIQGAKSGLISEVFRLIEGAKRRPQFVVLENVAFIQHLKGGAALDSITKQFERLGYQWCYRILDTQFFGVPQRRRRMFFVASLDEDPRKILLSNRRFALPLVQDGYAAPCGFYWTEGNTGLGWAVDSIPPLKSGSSVSIPSPPAVWLPKTGEFLTPSIADAEQLQGFPIGWTSAPLIDAGISTRQCWQLLGNAVSVPVSEWIGRRLAKPLQNYSDHQDTLLSKSARWPTACWGVKGERYSSFSAQEGLGIRKSASIAEYLRLDPNPLSKRASKGFLSRLQQSTLRVPKLFVKQLIDYVAA